MAFIHTGMTFENKKDIFSTRQPGERSVMFWADFYSRGKFKMPFMKANKRDIATFPC